jgi:SAM-dependent methyltransferase
MKYKNCFLVFFLLLSATTDKHTMNFKNSTDAKNRFTRAIQFYQFQKHETIVSIGAEDCENEVIYGLMSDSVNFILENISAKVLSKTQLNEAKEFYEEKFHQKNNCTYIIQYGNDTSTLLTSHSVDKVIIENTFHEFSEPQKMLKDVYRILKPNGKLFLYEIIGTPKYKIHKHCRLYLYSKEELNTFAKKANFKIIRTEKGEDEICDGCSSLIELEKD